MSAAEKLVPFHHLEQLRAGREVLRREGEALLELSQRLDAAFCAAVEIVANCPGSAIVSGMGKAGLIGRKLAATLSSTGTRAFFLHPAEAVHGDVGCLGDGDCVIALSNSGETEEICRLLPIVRRLDASLIAVTGRESSTLGRSADVTLVLGRLREADSHGLAPTTTTTAMLALGDALALVVSRLKGFTPQQFAVFHPAGSLGRRLMRVREIMRTGEALRVASEEASIRDVLIQAGRPGRRSGAVMLTDASGRLSGLFTDSDLARLLESRRDEQLDRPVREVMTAEPLTAAPDDRLAGVVEVLSSHKISELPVVDGNHRPLGLIDITDVIGLVPTDGAA